MSLTRRADPLRFIAVRLHIPELEHVVRQPGIGEAYRITVQYHDGRHPDQVATLIFRQGTSNPALSVLYRRPNDQPLTLTYPIPNERARAFTSALRALNFDKLDDPPDIPWYGADLWLVERVSGSFQHDVVIAPERVSDNHAQIVALVRAQLREALRTINNG